MGKIRYVTSNRPKKCRLCEETIEPNAWCIALEDVHVPPKRLDLFFHDTCFVGGSDWVDQNRDTRLMNTKIKEFHRIRNRDTGEICRVLREKRNGNFEINSKYGVVELSRIEYDRSWHKVPCKEK